MESGRRNSERHIILSLLQNGLLVYNTYANQGKAIRSIQFLTSRSAGIRAVMAIPFVDVKRTISPVSGDNTQNIQSAIDFVSGLPLDANGFRGAVLPQRGRIQRQ